MQLGMLMPKAVKSCLSGIRVEVLHNGGSCGRNILAGNKWNFVGCKHAGDPQLARSGRLLEEVLEYVLCAQSRAAITLAFRRLHREQQKV